ncbi:MAG: insulinase family protein, partial [Bacteroidota bacterium]|nr:insulinase family protein [Bacteroidota bacterium]
WELPNGIKVSAKPTVFKNDEILMSAYSPGGHSLYDASKYPSARSVSSVIQASGVGPYNATGLDKKLSTQRVSVTPFVFERFEGLSGSSSVADRETLMQLAYSWITAYRKDSVALSAYINRERARYGNLLADPQNYFFDRVTKIITQNHPRRGYPTMESYDQIKLDEIMDIYKDRFKDVSDMNFFFVGNFDPVDLQKLTGRYLGALPGGGRKETYKDVGERMPSGVVDSVYNRGEAPSSLVQILYHGNDNFEPDQAYILQSLIEVARIKLRESLREEESGVYGVSINGGQTNFPIEQYSIRIGFNADPPRTKELVDAAKAVLEKLRHEIDPADIVKVTETQRQGRVKDLQQNQFWMGAFINSWQNNLPMEQMVEMAELDRRIAALNKEVLLKAANKYFNEKEVISVVMYPDKT